MIVVQFAFFHISCRGVDVAKWVLSSGWTAQGVDSGSPFDDIDLSENEWYDVDEKTGESVSFIDVETQVVVAEKKKGGKKKKK
jgi:hypothetical protein